MKLPMLLFFLFLLDILSVFIGVLLGYTRSRAAFGITPYINMASAGLYSMAVLLLFVVCRYGFGLGKGPFRWYYLLTLVMAPLWIMIGILNDYKLIQVAGDTVYGLLHVAYFLLGCSVASRYRPDQVGDLGRCLLLLGWLQIFVWGILKVLGVNYGLPTSFMFALAVVCLFSWSLERFLIAIPFLLIALSSINLSYLAGILLAVPVAFPLVKRKIYGLLAAAILCSILGFLYHLNYKKSVDTGRRDTISRAQNVLDALTGEVEISKIQSLEQRIYEMERVSEVVATDGISTILGRGYGASIDMSDAPDDAVKISAILGEGLVHNIHFMWSAFHLRYGILGIVLFSYFVICMVWLVVKGRQMIARQGGVDIDYFLLCYCVCELGVFLFASNFYFTNWVFSFGIGWLSVRCQNTVKNPVRPHWHPQSFILAGKYDRNLQIKK